jgi:hypothetical protein
MSHSGEATSPEVELDLRKGTCALKESSMGCESGIEILRPTFF